MSYPFQIKSQEQYEKAYRESVERPEEFWASVAENFQQLMPRTLQADLHFHGKLFHIALATLFGRDMT